LQNQDKSGKQAAGGFLGAQGNGQTYQSNAGNQPGHGNAEFLQEDENPQNKGENLIALGKQAEQDLVSLQAELGAHFPKEQVAERPAPPESPGGKHYDGDPQDPENQSFITGQGDGQTLQGQGIANGLEGQFH